MTLMIEKSLRYTSPASDPLLTSDFYVSSYLANSRSNLRLLRIALTDLLQQRIEQLNVALAPLEGAWQGVSGVVVDALSNAAAPLAAVDA